MAVSIQGLNPVHYDDAARFAEDLSQKVSENGLTFGTFLNVNLPDLPLNQTAGIRISRQGVSLYQEYVEKKIDPRKRPYYWYGADTTTPYNASDIDEAALDDNYIENAYPLNTLKKHNAQINISRNCIADFSTIENLTNVTGKSEQIPTKCD